MYVIFLSKYFPFLKSLINYQNRLFFTLNMSAPGRIFHGHKTWITFYDPSLPICARRGWVCSLPSQGKNNCKREVAMRSRQRKEPRHFALKSLKGTSKHYINVKWVNGDFHFPPGVYTPITFCQWKVCTSLHIGLHVSWQWIPLELSPQCLISPVLTPAQLSHYLTHSMHKRQGLQWKKKSACTTLYTSGA